MIFKIILLVVNQISIRLIKVYEIFFNYIKQMIILLMSLLEILFLNQLPNYTVIQKYE